MKHLFIVVGVLLASSAFGADNRRALEKAVEIGQFGNAGADVVRYRVLNVDRILRELSEDLVTERGKCSYENVVGTAAALRIMAKVSWLQEDENRQVRAILSRLASSRQIKTIVGRYMTGNGEGNSYCDLYYFDVFTVDGYRARLRWDFTD